MKTPDFLLYLAVCAGVTYLIRMLPLVLVKKKITNRFIRSFFYYVPYAVLAVLTFPAIFHATAHIASGIAATVVAAVLAFFDRSLIAVAAGSAAAALISELIITII